MANEKVTLGFTEIKKPFAFMINHTPASCVWFEAGGKVLCWDDLTQNYPRWSISVHTKEQAITRIREMVVKDNWCLLESSEDKLYNLVDKT